eukprot:3032912-Rhodomonas_salina.3
MCIRDRSSPSYPTSDSDTNPHTPAPVCSPAPSHSPLRGSPPSQPPTCSRASFHFGMDDELLVPTWTFDGAGSEAERSPALGFQPSLNLRTRPMPYRVISDDCRERESGQDAEITGHDGGERD